MYLELEKVRNLLVVEVEMNKDLKKQVRQNEIIF